MSWQNRVRSTIDFTSPDGDNFSAYWKGDEYTLEKNVAEFDFPDFDGTIAQDLGTKSRRFPLTFFFEGTDNDLTAKRFDDALKQKGRWTVSHPVLGTLDLQPVNLSIATRPTESGNITAITSEWIEPADEVSIASTAELGASAAGQANQVGETAAGQVDENTVQDTAKQTASIKSVAEKTVGTVQKTTAALTQGVAELSNGLNQVIRGIQDTIDNTVIPMLSLAGQIRELIELPQRASDDFQSRIAKYTELANEILGITPAGNNEDDKNTVAMQELVLTGLVSTAALICTNSEYDTKQQAIEAALALIALFNDTTDALDAAQANFSGNDIDKQYFSQSQSFTDLYNMVAIALQYLLSSVYNLSIEKKIILQKPTIPAEIVIQEYGSLGENDIFLDIFIAINKLKGTEILLMPPLKEVVVYV